MLTIDDKIAILIDEGYTYEICREDKNGTIVGCYLDKHYIEKASKERYDGDM